MDEDKSSQKELFRRECIKKLREVAGQSKFKKDKEINKKLIALIEEIKPKSMLLYVPLGFEPNIRDVYKKYRGRKQLYVPFMEGASFKMVKYRLPLFEKKFGIKEPSTSFFRLAKIDLAVIPVVGVDRSFRRIGFGKGMYDRFFGQLRTRPVVIFVQTKPCITNKTITDDYDVMGDILVTPNDTTFRRVKNVDRDYYRRFRRRY